MKRPLSRFRLWLLSLSCPRFYEDMPTKEVHGEWKVGTIVRGLCYSRVADEETFVGSLRDAYIRARQLASKRDSRYPSNAEIGIDWFVNGVKKHDGFIAENI